MIKSLINLKEQNFLHERKSIIIYLINLKKHYFSRKLLRRGYEDNIAAYRYLLKTARLFRQMRNSSAQSHYNSIGIRNKSDYSAKSRVSVARHPTN